MFFILARRQCRSTRFNRTLHSDSNSGRSPFEILFMGGDEFSAVVFEQLVAAKGTLTTAAPMRSTNVKLI